MTEDARDSASDTQEQDALPFGVVVGDNVRRLRQESGLSQSEFAGLLSAFGPAWARGKVIALEAGKRDTVTIDELCQLSGCLRAPLTEFFAGDGEMQLGGPTVVDQADLRWSLEHVDHVRLNLNAPEAVVAFQALVDEDWAAFEAAQQLDLSLGQVRALARRLFGQSTTKERDARVGDVDDPGDAAYRRRGVSQQLIREFQQAIDQEDQA